MATYFDLFSSVTFADLKLLASFARLSDGGPGSPLFVKIEANLLLTSMAAELYCSSFALNEKVSSPIDFMVESFNPFTSDPAKKGTFCDFINQNN